ncbi:unnamed protein product [Albugo candida]|uniref:Uncharacterized protein n=1 Tax=Albugo candida TaxID=65357 RepID=A0A024FVU4_9STRA|nr:unnamed protein product [Albugo candida]|eukprot:CCI11293.1 unnamed protein product [Albugo candida]
MGRRSGKHIQNTNANQKYVYSRIHPSQSLKASLMPFCPLLNARFKTRETFRWSQECIFFKNMQLLEILLPSTLNASLINVQSNKLLVEPDTVQNEKTVGKQESERLKKEPFIRKKI